MLADFARESVNVQDKRTKHQIWMEGPIALGALRLISDHPSLVLVEPRILRSLQDLALSGYRMLEVGELGEKVS
jgi:hypothetical protein